MADPNDLWSDGYVKIPRRFFPKEGYRGPGSKEPARRPEAIVDLYMLANHDERNGLPRGCCEPSLGFLAERWHLPRTNVVRLLESLVQEGVIAREKWEGRKHMVTRFLTYDPPLRTGTQAGRHAAQRRYSETQPARGVSHAPRYSREVAPGTGPGPNRTRSLGSPRKVEVPERRACPACWQVEIDSEDECFLVKRRP